MSSIFLEIDGFLDEREAKLALYEFLRNNTTFATDLLMGVKLFPFQHMAISSIFLKIIFACRKDLERIPISTP